jgi:hypothetical protein
MTAATEARLRQLLAPGVTDVTEASLGALDVTLLSAHDEEARALGIRCDGGAEVLVAVADPTRRLGHIQLQAGGAHNTLFFDNRRWGGNFHANIRFLGGQNLALFNDIGDEYVALQELFMRSDGQFLFWGRGASAVGCSLEIEGTGRGVVVGDDALISSGVWVRNYDMHSVFDLATGTQINRPPVDTVIERHVWLGQDALLLTCERVGTGSIIGARAVVKGEVPPRVAAAGAPARPVREGVSWGRNGYLMTAAERRAVGVPERPAG